MIYDVMDTLVPQTLDDVEVCAIVGMAYLKRPCLFRVFFFCSLYIYSLSALSLFLVFT